MHYMNLANIKIKKRSDLTGKVKLDSSYSYEVFGPFGQGYNIKISRLFKSAKLNFHWRDGPGAFGETPEGKYEMSDDMMFKGGCKILSLAQDGSFAKIDDEFALALFVINHHFYRKSGPFNRENA